MADANQTTICAKCAEPAELAGLCRVHLIEREQTTGWLPFDAAPEDVGWTAMHARPPQLGEHVGKVFTLPSGQWLVLKYPNTGEWPESYIILPEPPK